LQYSPAHCKWVLLQVSPKALIQGKRIYNI
jgi:hypothetical protein